MKNIAIAFFSMFTVFGCKQNDIHIADGDELELTLLTKEFSCVENVYPEEYRFNGWRNSEYDSLANNFIKFKLVNNSKTETYFLVLDLRKIGTLEALSNNFTSSGPKNKITVNLYNGEKTVNGYLIKNGRAIDSAQELKFRTFEKNAKEMNLYENSEIINEDTQEVSEKSFLLKPGEVRYFETSIYLPFRKGSGQFVSLEWLSLVDSNTDFANITLVNIGSITKSNLSKKQKKEVLEKGLVLLNDTIYSNKVPVKMAKMKAH